MGRRIVKLLGIALIIIAVLIVTIPYDRTEAVVLDEFQMDHDILAKYTGTATAVSVSDTVKYIGEESFAGNQTIASVDTGKNLKEIKHAAFANSPYLHSVSNHDVLEKIDTAAFAGCGNLEIFNIGANVNDIGYGVFAGCNRLSTVNVSRNNDKYKVIGGGLYNNTGEVLVSYLNGYNATYYKMPDSVNKINKYSFWGNEKLDSVSISPYVSDISAYSFSNCKNLKFVNIPYSVTTIGAKAFENCISLADISIPASVSYIDPTAFDGCGKLNIIADEGTAAYEFFKNFDSTDVSRVEKADTKTIIIPKEEPSVEETSTNEEYKESPTELVENISLVDASKDPSNVEYMPTVDPLSVIDDDNVLAKTVVVGGNAVLFLSSGQQLNSGIVTDTNATDANIDSNAIDNASNDDSDQSVIYDSKKGGYLPKFTENDGKIAMQAYYASSDMTDYSFPQDITAIGDFSFARSNISTAEIPTGVTSIGYGAFYHCDDLANVSIPNTVTDIEAHAFENTPYMNNFISNVSGGDFLIVGDGILIAYKGQSATVNIPNGVKKIAPCAFMNNISISNLSLPDSVTDIGDDAFRGCNVLTSVAGGNNLKNIGDRAFMGCPISTMVIPASVENIGLRAIDYSDCDKTNSTKVVVFEGDSIPKISAGKLSKRLENDNYRNDSLYNVLFAIVNEDVNDYSETVLDSDKLGFSGLILTKEKDEAGNDTGSLIVKDNYIFSDEVIENIPETVTVNGSNYTIKDFDLLESSGDTRMVSDSSASVDVVYDGNITDAIMATFSESENVGKLYINTSDEASDAIGNKYAELFGEDNVPNIAGYDISLADATDTCNINKFGKATLNITMPIPKGIEDGTYHVVAIDEDGQLEEVSALIDNENIEFDATHLSFYGIYSIDDSNGITLLRNGTTVRNLKKDASPDTGDMSLNIKYVVAFMLVCVGAFLLIMKKKNIENV